MQLSDEVHISQHLLFLTLFHFFVVIQHHLKCQIILRVDCFTFELKGLATSLLLLFSEHLIKLRLALCNQQFLEVEFRVLTVLKSLEQQGA